MGHLFDRVIGWNLGQKTGKTGGYLEAVERGNLVGIEKQKW
jgi:hypothetical protein